MYWIDLTYLVPLLFIAGVLDGIAGGGGIISLPSYMLTGMPIHSAYACNKLQSGFGTFCSAFKYAKEGFADIKMTLFALPFTIGASFLATELIMNTDSEKVKLIVLCCIPIAVALMFCRRKISGKTVNRKALTVKNILLSMLAGALLGAYDALFGPGGGTIAMILFSVLLGYDLRVGNGNGKIIIVASNITAVIKYILSGYMIYHVAIPCALANMIGSYIGASVVIKKGEKIVFPAMFVVIGMLVIQTLLGVFK
jgi:uncharacterized membrane protein YfcA